MCGIAGISINNAPVSQLNLQNLASTMNHRGPDATGFFLSKDKHTGLTHNRLSIIDLSESANQPMCNEDESLWLVFNGEIYNFQQIKDFLRPRGHRFKSESDSEVIVHLFEEKGIDLVEDLNGMFAFGIFDEKQNKLFLARDRVGIKPLYYLLKNGTFAFSSELKALLSLPQVSKDLDFEALDYYFTLGYIPESLSIFKDVRKLRPGHTLEFDGHEPKIKKYWSLVAKRDELHGRSESDLVDELEAKLRDSVSIRLVSDVPIGTFLSGGLDSSLVTTIMAQEADVPIRTYTIGFGPSEYDETPYAKIVADEIGSIHKEHYIDIDVVTSLEKLINFFDEPFADSSLIPTYYISKIAKESVTVILSGDGGDELFGGYNWYSWLLLLDRLKMRLGSTRKIMSYLSKFLPHSFRGKHMLSVLHLDVPCQFLERVSFFQPEEKIKLYMDGLKSSREKIHPEKRFLEFFQSNNGSLVDKMTFTDFHYYLPEDILTKVDRASMAVSLETRVPWLDHRLVEFAYSLPQELRIKGNLKKYLPKELAKKVLPKSFPVDRKQGFNIPINQWMSGQLGHLLEDELNNATLSGLINTDYVSKLLHTHRKHKKINLGPRLFSILMFALWSKKYLASQ